MAGFDDPASLEALAARMTASKARKEQFTLAEAIRSRSTIDWHRLQTADYINDRQLQLLINTDLAETDEMERVDHIEAAGALFPQTVVTLLARCHADTEILQYLLTLVRDVVRALPDELEAFASSGADAVGTLLALKDQDDDYVVWHAVDLVLRFRSSGFEALALSAQQFEDFFGWVLAQLRGGEGAHTNAALAALAALLDNNENRERLFNAHPRSFENLVDLLAGAGKDYQRIYDVAYIVWMLSFSRRVCPHLAARNDVVPMMIHKARTVPKEQEKVVRVTLGVLRNVLDRGGDDAGQILVNSGVTRTLTTLDSRTWKDDDIVAAVSSLFDDLEEFERDVSTFGAYAEEVTSMDLKWAPLHKSEAFWTANNERLCDDDYRLLRILVRLVQAGEVAEVVCVALNDLGWFASKHPRGRRIVDELGGKAAAMQLMGSENEDVSAAALKTTQRLLLRREWNLGN